MQTMDKISTPAIDKNRLKSKWVEKGYLQSDIARELQLSPAGFSRKIFCRFGCVFSLNLST